MLRRALQKWHYPVTSLTTDLLHPDFAENLKAAQLVDRNCFRFIPWPCLYKYEFHKIAREVPIRCGELLTPAFDRLTTRMPVFCFGRTH